MSSSKTAIQTTYFSIIGNALLALIKLLAGYFGHSFALIADALESTVDVFSSILVLFGLKYASKPADKNHPYGHGKMEAIITIMVGSFLVFSAIMIAKESIHNIQTPHQLPAPWTLIILGLIIVWKEASYQYVISQSRKTNSSSLKSDAWHHRSDAITSVMAFLGISIANILGPGYEAADDWAALIASGIILYNSFLIIRPALGELTDEHQYDELVDEIRIKSKEVPGIIDTEKCYIRKSGMTYQIDLHAIVDANISVKKGHELAHDLQDHLHETIPNLGHISVHIEPSEEN